MIDFRFLLNRIPTTEENRKKIKTIRISKRLGTINAWTPHWIPIAKYGSESESSEYIDEQGIVKVFPNIDGGGFDLSIKTKFPESGEFTLAGQVWASVSSGCISYTEENLCEQSCEGAYITDNPCVPRVIAPTT